MPITVSQLTAQIKHLLENHFKEVLLQGEVSNCKLQSSGHLYFSLKDPNAQISCVLFRSNASTLKKLPKDGDKVVVRGEISLYEPRGSYQIIVRELTFAGLGALLLQLEKLKEKLRSQGWLDAARKRAIPAFPKCIGVVTSPTGAVIQDILQILGRRSQGFHLILNPVKVQGEGAAQEIALAIEEMNRFGLCDVLIVGRGGGSLEDLWAFNEEIVAKAIFESAIPVISAVGHESDVTIADLVADERAPTPSAAAEIVSKERGAQLAFLQKTRASLHRFVTAQIRSHKVHLQTIQRHPAILHPSGLLERKMQKLDEIRASLELSVTRRKMALTKYRQALLYFHKNFYNILSHQLQVKKERLHALKDQLSAVDPRNLLKKGYAILFSEKEPSLIISRATVASGDRVVAHLHDGKIKLLVSEVEHDHL